MAELEELTYKELQALCKEKKLKASGMRQELIARLKEAEGKEAEEETEEAEEALRLLEEEAKRKPPEVAIEEVEVEQVERKEEVYLPPANGLLTCPDCRNLTKQLELLKIDREWLIDDSLGLKREVIRLQDQIEKGRARIGELETELTQKGEEIRAKDARIDELSGRTEQGQLSVSEKAEEPEKGPEEGFDWKMAFLFFAIFLFGTLSGFILRGCS